ncbi:MAG: trehalose-phosphatase [Thermoanaerobaculia bacterium]
MKNILSHAHREVLEQFVWSEVVLAFDLDGTLAPIVPDPSRAKLRPETRDLLSQVARLFRVIVISGRSQSDAIGKLGGVNVLGVIGNHGIEPWHKDLGQLEEVERWMPALDSSLRSLPGVTIENKKFSLAIHYRHSREKARAREAILDAAARLDDARIIGGKQVVNLLPQGAPHKGMALERERERLHCDTAIYVGDDETDEDVFALDQPGRLLTIRVGPNRTSAAMYSIPDQSSIDELLRVLLDLRHESGQRRRALR